MLSEFAPKLLGRALCKIPNVSSEGSLCSWTNTPLPPCNDESLLGLKQVFSALEIKSLVFFSSAEILDGTTVQFMINNCHKVVSLNSL